MTDIAITAASVLSGASGAIVTNGVAGEALTAGKVVYLDPATNKWFLAANNAGTTIARSPGGIALGGAAVGQPVAVHTSGPITIGGALTAGVAYYLSATAGGICPVADLGTGKSPVIIGIATSTTVLDVRFHASGVIL